MSKCSRHGKAVFNLLLCMFCFSSANKNNVLQNVSTDNKKVRQPANFYESRVTRSMLEHDLVFVIFIRGDLIKKNGKKDDIMHISNYPLPPCLKVTTERVTTHKN